MKKLIKDICPSMLSRLLYSFKQFFSQKNINNSNNSLSDKALKNPEHQELEIYWDSKMAEVLETWGEGTVWHELKFLMMGLEGKVLDIACGTGKNISDLSSISALDLYGCDISDLLIQKAVERGLSLEKLRICDATLTGFENDFFDHAYSIGSFEHFTEDGIEKVISESYRITKYYSFHHVPVSIKNENEGWVKDYLQSFFNNSVEWWLEKFRKSYPSVLVLDSLWKSSMSKGVWFICSKSCYKI